MDAPKYEHLVETQRRLSQSMLWRLQRAFYERRGVAAWSTGTVPWFVTSNTAMARAYAEVIDAWVRDVAAGACGPLDPTRPIHLIELGAGHGRLGFLLLQRLAAVAERNDLARGGPRPPLRYVMTDFTEANLRFLDEHPALQPFFASGALDLARFDAEHDAELHLRRSGEVLSAERGAGPIIVVANYVFDSLLSDAFRVDRGVLHESLGALYSTQPEPDLDDPALLERVVLRYEHVPVARKEAGQAGEDGAGYYGQPDLDAILDEYRAMLDDTVVCFPTGALGCVRNLHRLAGGRLLLLSADKGYIHEEDLLRRPEPQPVFHGSFSLTVNYHAIAAWFRHAGGLSLGATPRDGTITANAFLAGAPAGALGRTHAAFAEHVERFGPMDFMVLQDQLRAGSPDKGDKPASLASLLALLRLGDWDPWLFYHLADAILPQLEGAGEALQRETRRALGRIWASYYHIGGTQDVPFEIARVWSRLGNYAEALAFYQRSLDLFGDSHVTHHNIGLCHHWSHRYPEALAEFDKALAMSPDYGPSRTWRLKVQAELR